MSEIRSAEMDIYHNLKIHIPNIEPNSPNFKHFKPSTVSPHGRLGSNPDFQIIYDKDEQGNFTDECKRFHVSASRGGRRFMEDTFSAVPEIMDSTRSFYGVWDGHGKPSGCGFDCAHFCADSLTELFLKFDTSWDHDVKKNFSDAFQKIDRQYLSKFEKGGSTGTCAYINKNNLWTANTGDSRIVLCENGKAVDVTVDHHPCREDEKKRIEDAGGVVLCISGVWRVNGSISLSRSFGDKHMKDKNLLICDPEVQGPIRLTNDHEFMIVATDGIWNEMSSQDAVDIVRSALTHNKQPTEELLSVIDERGGGDNMCAIVVLLDKSLNSLPKKNVKTSQIQSIPVPLPSSRHSSSPKNLW